MVESWCSKSVYSFSRRLKVREGGGGGWDVTQHPRLNGHEFEQALGDSEGQGSVTCCNPWDWKESDRTGWTTRAATTKNMLSRSSMLKKKSGTYVNPWLFHSNVWQNSLQIKRKKKKKKDKEEKKKIRSNTYQKSLIPLNNRILVA